MDFLGIFDLIYGLKVENVTTLNYNRHSLVTAVIKTADTQYL